ncbi:MAG: GntR family transcriptional regulator [Hespellia sp.]|nr:GntR family transcriptional regulator [Hespellia sp.]
MNEERVPKYYLLRQELLKMIDDGTFEEGEPIMSERELIDKYHFSRITVRKAIDELVNEGYLYRIQGKGTYVKGDCPGQNLYSLNSCTSDVKRLGRNPSKKTIFAERKEADAKRAKQLNVNIGDNLFSFGRITLADNEPLNYTITYLPERLFPKLDAYDLEKESLYDVIQNNYGITISKARRTVEAVIPDLAVAGYLGIHAEMPVILFNCITYGIVLGKELPIECFRCYYKTDHYKFYIDQIN